MNLPTVIVALVVAGLAFLAARSLRKSGSCDCGGVRNRGYITDSMGIQKERYLNDKTRVRAIDSSDTGTRNVILEIPAAGERHLPPVVVSDEARQQHADYQRNGFWRHW